MLLKIKKGHAPASWALNVHPLLLGSGAMTNVIGVDATTSLYTIVKIYKYWESSYFHGNISARRNIRSCTKFKAKPYDVGFGYIILQKNIKYCPKT